jgi:hypothetical protein
VILKIVSDDILTRDARWFIFKPKNPNLGKFWRALDWKMLIYFTAIWYILCSFGIFFPVLESCTKKTLATLILSNTIK